MDLKHKPPSQDETSHQFLKTCRTGTLEAVEKLLVKISAPDEHRTKGDETSLHVAITSNPTPAPVARLLLRYGHDPNARGYRRQNRTPLHAAARRGCAETVRQLLAAGARVDAIKQGDWTPLMIACANGSSDAAKVLLQHGADVNARNGIGETGVHLSARVSAECLRLCLEAGGAVLARTRNGKTGLHYACRAGNEECVKLLLQAGCGVREKDRAGMNGVHEACVGGHDELVKMLTGVDGGAVWEKDIGGLNGLHHTAIHGNLRVAKVLVKLEGEIDAKDGRGNTAMDLARFNKHSDVAEVLSTVCRSATSVDACIMDSTNADH